MREHAPGGSVEAEGAGQKLDDPALHDRLELPHLEDRHAVAEERVRHLDESRGGDGDRDLVPDVTRMMEVIRMLEEFGQ